MEYEIDRCFNCKKNIIDFINTFDSLDEDEEQRTNCPYCDASILIVGKRKIYFKVYGVK